MLKKFLDDQKNLKEEVNTSNERIRSKMMKLQDMMSQNIRIRRLIKRNRKQEEASQKALGSRKRGNKAQAVNKNKDEEKNNKRPF